MRSSTALVALLCVIGCRRGAPPPPPPAAADLRPAADPAAARALLDKGRKASKRDLPAAIAAFQEARRLAPDDADVLSELGLAQLRAGALDAAREASAAAVQAARSDAQAAGAAYNLGRAEEAAGRLEEAVKAFELSVRKRPHPGVQKRLEATRARLTEGRPQALGGPFPSLEALCAGMRKAHEDSFSKDSVEACCTESCEYACPLLELGRLKKGLPKGIDEVRVFWTRLREKPDGIEGGDGTDDGPGPDEWTGAPRCGFASAALRAGKEWYGAPALASFCDTNHLSGTVELKRVWVEPVSGGLVVLHLASRQSYRWEGDARETLTFLGVGASGKPARIGPVTILQSEYGETNPKEEDSVETREETRYSYRIADGAILFTGQTTVTGRGARDRKRSEPLSIRYPLALP